MNTRIVLLAAVVLAAGATGARAQSGADLYLNHCAACHGADGEGTGPVAAAMRVGVPNLRTLAMRNGGVFPEDDVQAYIEGRTTPASHGDRQMPIWGDVFKEGERGRSGRERARERIAAIVDFIAGLQYR
jgi:mono/diheme cytochrome c family protein